VPDLDELDGPLYKLADYCGRCGKLDKEGAHARYYCPRCHEVTCGMKRHGEWIALPHYRNGEEPLNRHGRTDRKPCVGGPIDPKEDRAP
jgi:hypothetical protein